MGLREVFDNLSKVSDKWEPYLQVYHNHLFGYRFETKPVTLVEVGVQGGGSLEMWSTWLPKAKVIGIDYNTNCAKLDFPNHPNISGIIGNQGDPNFWDDFLERYKGIDIFIDDGSHNFDHQILTFEKVWPKLNMGGVYICEDIHTSYAKDYGGKLKAKWTFVEYAKTLIDVLHQDWLEQQESDIAGRIAVIKDLTSIHFYDSICVMHKFGKTPMSRILPKKFSWPE